MATAADLLRNVRPKRLDPLRARLRVRRLTGRLAVVILIGAAFAAGAAAGTPTTGSTGSTGATAELVGVPVAARDLPAGHTIADHDVTLRTFPASAVVGEAAPDPIGRTVSAPIYAGEPVIDVRLGAGGRFGLADGQVAVGVVPPLAPIPIAEGDIVALLAVGLDPLGDAVAEPLGRARVVAVDDRAVTVAVADDLAPAVLEAQAVGTVEITLTP